MRPLSDKTYERQAISLGRDLVNSGVIPDFSNDPSFQRGFALNMVRTGDHLDSYRGKTVGYHPEHHLFVGHVFLHASYIVFGDGFRDVAVEAVQVPGHKKPMDVFLSEQEDRYRTLLEFYADDMASRQSFGLYEALRDSKFLHEQVSVIERHVQKIPAGREVVSDLECTMFDMALYAQDHDTSSGKSYRPEVIQHTYLVGALVKRIHAAEQLKARGLTSFRVYVEPEPAPEEGTGRKARKRRKKHN